MDYGGMKHPHQVLLLVSRSDLIEIEKIEEEDDLLINYLVVYLKPWCVNYCME